MKVVDFIKRLESFGYDDDTEINFGYCTYDGEWYDFNVDELEYDGSFNIDVLFEPNEDYKKECLSEIRDELACDIEKLLAKYC